MQRFGGKNRQLVRNKRCEDKTGWKLNRNDERVWSAFV
jgi:hypothetical protein